jgi:hypothetical protein
MEKKERPEKHDFSQMKLKSFPMQILDYAQQTKLMNFGGCQLKGLPQEFHLFQNLETLFFANNLFESIPEVLGRLPKLFMLSFKSCKLKEISEVSLSPSIGWLILTDNKLSSLPASIGKLEKLQKCMLSSNLLCELPETMKHCTKLELLRLADNQFTSIPEWLLQLPRLFWFALSGNPILESTLPSISNLPSVDYRDLEMGEVLGQGASGIVYKAYWKGKQEDVAVKMFKGAATSDGLPQEEMKAMEAAGSHPNAIQVMGRLKDVPSPDGTEQLGLVLPLIPSHFTILGNSPSFQSITRDTYEKGKTFALIDIQLVAYGIASVMAHLHSRSLAHGDLYAHNILTCFEEKRVYLTDYGACWSFESLDIGEQEAIKRLEIGAYGCLLEDMLSRTKSDEKTWELISELKLQCLSPNRPTFKEIVSWLTL